jgi:NAD-dependent dihydropyrimidine dehydrogenase PreA subunit
MVYVVRELCVACGRCALYCPVEAITVGEYAFVDQERCVECGTCIRAECPVDALRQPELKPPRLLRKLFSDPLATFKETEVPGRGTEEMKTNDVTNNVKFGEAGWGVEMGRPGVSTSFADVEKVAMALARHGVEFLDLNPVTMLIDKRTGRFTEKNPWGISPGEIRALRALSAIIEFKTPKEKVPEIIETLKEVSREVDTVFSVGIISRWRDGEPEVLPILKGIPGIRVYPNGKHNMGLGRPGP